MADVTPPSVVVITPLNGAAGVLINAAIEFNVVDTPEGGTLAETAISIADYFARDDLSSQVDGSTTLFTADGPFIPGSLEVWLGGFDQTSRFTETDPAAGTFTFSGPPLVPENPLIIRRLVPWAVNGVDLMSVEIKIDTVPIFQNGLWTPGYDGTIEPIDYGYHFTITVHPAFTFSALVTVDVDATDMADPPNAMTTFEWTFTTISQIQHAYPYISNESPFDAEFNVAVSAIIAFDVKTDDLTTPATAILANEMVSLNGQTIIQNGVNILPGQYTVGFIYSLRKVNISITPIAALTTDTVYIVTGTFEDDVGNVGMDGFVFSTGAVGYAMQIDRQEPLLCPIDTEPFPVLSTKPDIQTTVNSDIIASTTTDWSGRGLTAYDAIEILDGPDAGRWLIRQALNTYARLFHVFRNTASTRSAKAFAAREFADRNPAILTFSPLFDYKLLKAWGDTRLRYLAGYPSDINFPVAFDDVPIAVRHDQNLRIFGSASAVDGSNIITGSGTSFLSALTAGSRIRIGNTPETYTVLVTDTNTTLHLSHTFVYSARLTGKLSVNILTNVVSGVSTKFISELHVGDKIRFEGDSTTYTIATITSDISLTISPVAAATSTIVTANVVGLVKQPIYKVDNSNGAIFDDQTNQQLDFSLKCNPIPTLMSAPTPRWDRYGLLLKAKVKPVLSETAALIALSTTVTLSGALYREELHVGSVLTFGTSTTEYTVTAMVTAGVTHEITISPAWGGLSGSGQTVYQKIGGLRCLARLQVVDMPPRTEFFIGMNNSDLSPLNDGENLLGVSFVHTVNGSIEMRARLGSTVAIQPSGLSVGSFIDKDWIVELELLDHQNMQIRLFDPADLETARSSLLVENAAMPATSPTLDRWTITTFADGTADLNSRVIGRVDYVDVEHGTGQPFDLGTGLVSTVNVKARPTRNRTNIPLYGEQGWKTLSTAAAVVPSAFTPAQYDRIFWDTEDVAIVIESFEVEGGATQIVDGRTIKKFSGRQGFDQIDITFHANRRGFWYAVLDSTDHQTSMVAAKGVYDVAGAPQSLTLFGELFTGIGDGSHQVNIVVCKDPIRTGTVFLQGTASILAFATIT